MDADQKGREVCMMSIPVNGLTATRRTGLALPSDLSLAEWSHLGQQIHVIADSSAWWLGDWLVFGQEHYPGHYRRTVEQTSLDYQTLRNYAWVARKFSPGRRWGKLSFQHHAEVAAVPEAEQDAWLTQAEEGGWSRNELRRRMRVQRQSPDVSVESALVQVSVVAERRIRWQHAAEIAGLGLADWIVQMLDEAADDFDPPISGLAAAPRALEV
ncbi:LmbU family transcriptional regulator [Streptomyces sp. NPDC087263]|uniref:LmbU family transcriptional regulator n=1 Tax=Streptomyces sp. NPDC087263 TaxID=3365773 RepID=UPI0038248D53